MIPGTDAGTFVAPPLFGMLMEEGHGVWLFHLATFMLILAVLTVMVAQHVHGQRGVPA